MTRLSIVLFLILLSANSHAARKKKTAQLLSSGDTEMMDDAADESPVVENASDIKICKQESEWLKSLGLNEQGIFAIQNIKKGEVIDWYEGKVHYSPYEMTKYRFSSRITERKEFIYFLDVEMPKTHEYLYSVDGYYPNAHKMSLSAFANHKPGRLANARFISRTKLDAPHGVAVALVAKRAIRKGEEITVDYGAAYEEKLQQESQEYRKFLINKHPKLVVVNDDSDAEVRDAPFRYAMGIMPSLIRLIENGKRKSDELQSLDVKLIANLRFVKSDAEALSGIGEINELTRLYMQIRVTAHRAGSLSQNLIRLTAARLAICYYQASLIILSQQLRSARVDVKQEYLREQKESLVEVHRFILEALAIHPDDYVLKELDAHIANYSVRTIYTDQNIFLDDAEECKDFANDLIDEDEFRFKSRDVKLQHRRMAITMYQHALYVLGENNSDDENLMVSELVNEGTRLKRLRGDIYWTLANVHSDELYTDLELAAHYSFEANRNYNQAADRKPSSKKIVGEIKDSVQQMEKILSMHETQ